MFVVNSPTHDGSPRDNQMQWQCNAGACAACRVCQRTWDAVIGRFAVLDQMGKDARELAGSNMGRIYEYARFGVNNCVHGIPKPIEKL